MIRVTVPRPVAEALMPGRCNRCLGFGYLTEHTKVPCPVLHCFGGSLPPVLRLLVVEGDRPAPFGEYPVYRRFSPNVRRFGPNDCTSFEDCEMREGDTRCRYAGCSYDFNRRVPPAAIDRAIEAGERIGIDVDRGCGRCGGVGFLVTHPYAATEDDTFQCPDCSNGRVPIGSVRPVRVMPVVGYMRGRAPDAPCIEVVTASYVREWYECPPDATHDRIMHRMVDLSFYGPAESLVGQFAVEVTDASTF